MRAIRSTESSLNLLKVGSLKPFKSSRRGNSCKTFDLGKFLERKQAFTSGTVGNYAASRFYRPYERSMKLREIIQVRPLSNSVPRDISLLNPNKLDPESPKDTIAKPISPLTLARFPKSDQQIPSVTKILQATMPAASVFILDRWKEAMVKKLGVAGFAKYQQETFERGRLLHAVVANYLLGHGTPGEQISKEIVANLWTSIQNVIKDKISNVRLVEHIVTHSDLRYRGIVDCVAFYENELVVIDFKTAEKPKKNVSSLYDNPLQVTAYCGAINNDKNIPEHVIDRNICAGLVIVAYIDGSEASVYHLKRDVIVNEYWKQWTNRLEQFTRMEEAKQDNYQSVSGDKIK